MPGVDSPRTAERGQANRIGGEVSLETFTRWCRSLDGFDVGGQAVEVDTTDFGAADLEGMIRAAREFMG